MMQPSQAGKAWFYGDQQPQVQPPTVNDLWSWSGLGGDVPVVGTGLTPTGMTFNGQPSSTYLVEVVGAYAGSSTLAGLNLVLDAPGAQVVGMTLAMGSGTTAAAVAQVTPGAAVAPLTATPAAGANTPFVARWLVKTPAVLTTVSLLAAAGAALQTTTLKAGLVLLGYRKVL